MIPSRDNPCKDPLFSAENAFCLGLINGRFATADDMEKEANALGVSFGGNTFSIMAFNLDRITSHFFESTTVSSDDWHLTCFMIENVVDELLAGISHRWICTDSQVVCLVSSHAPAIQQLRCAGTRTSDVLSSNFGLEFSAVISGAGVGLLSVKKLYQEVLTLRDYYRIMGMEKSVLCYDDFPRTRYAHAREAEFDYSTRFLKSVENANYPDAKKTFNEYLDFAIGTACLSPESTKLFYYGIRYLIFLAVEKMRTCSDVKTELLLMPESLKLDSSLPKIRKKFNFVLDYMANRAAAPHAPAWLNEVVKFIDANYLDVNLNIASIGEHFSLSAAHLSKTFRRFVGVSIPEYINRLRIAEAKELIASGVSVSKAASRSGYGSTMTMRRAFKKFDGGSPARLRI